MPYININEYDYTITGPKELSSNIVALPINANDGPSDKWVTVYTYDEFIQIFGSNPNPSTTFGNSWEYAANLLLRNMPVCVRRITHTLSEDGENEDLLEGVSIAKTIIKVADVINPDITSGKYDEGVITVEDTAGNSTLNSSIKGTEYVNTLYKQILETVDGKTTLAAFPNATVLQQAKDEDIYKAVIGEEGAYVENPIFKEAGAFADVSGTGTEWNCVSVTGKDNPHYKYVVYGESTPMSTILSMDQNFDSNGNKYVIGDFFITDDDNAPNHIVKYVPESISNKYLINNDTVGKNYPDDLLDIVITDDLVANHSFIKVTKDMDNETTKNYAWIYTPDKPTTVLNHKFINGNISVEGKDYKIFENVEALPKDGISVGCFAGVENSGHVFIVDLDGTWGDLGVELDILENVNSQYSILRNIPFSCTEQVINTGIYKYRFNWINTGEAEGEYIDDNHKELAYVKTIFWENSGNPIGTRPHVTVEGYNMTLNTVSITTSANTTRTSLDLNVRECPIKIDSDFSDNRLVSGNFGLTNISDEAVKIYSFEITEKGYENGSKLIYNIGLENVKVSTDRITADPLLVLYDEINDKLLDDPIPRLDSTTNETRWYIDLAPGCTLYYNKNVVNGKFSFTVAGFNDFEIVAHNYQSAAGSYDIALTSKDGVIAEVTKLFVPLKDKEETVDYTDLPVKDANQNFNLFTAEYLYPGTNGNFLNVSLKTIINQGIYIYVYRNKQYLEKIELCPFRFRHAATGRINILDMDLNKEDIWKSILSNFGVLITKDGQAVDSNLLPINKYSVLPSLYGKYVKIDLNLNVVLKDVTSLVYLDSIYAQTGRSKFTLQNGKNPNDNHVHHEVHKCFAPLKDKYRYDIKFAVGGTFVDEIVYSKNIINPFAIDTEIRLIEDSIIDLAEARQDCVAYVDVPYDLPLENVPEYFQHISTSYAAAYDPWGYMDLATGGTKWMPPSFVQLYTHAKSIQNGNKLYLPPAGVRRAQVPEIIKTNHDITSNYITSWQNNETPQFINPIIWINGYDYTIYGQKTLYNIVNESDRYESALQDLNVRLVANEIKKLIFKTCVNLTFEHNNIITWNEFKSKIEPTLSIMQGEGVLTNYDILMGTETMTVADLNSGHIVGTVRVAITRAATDWDINFELTPNSVTFTEYDYNSSYSN